MTAYVGIAALFYVDAPHAESALRDALRALGASEIDEWEEGALELVETWDAEGRRVALLGGAPSQLALSIAERVSSDVGRAVPVLIATTHADFVGSRLSMESAVRAFEVRAGERREVPAPVVDEDALAYEDAEPRSFSMDPLDVAIAAAELGSSALDEARRALGLPQDVRTIRSARSHHRLETPRLAPRVQALVDAIARGATHREEEGPDGRWRVEVQDAAGKRISFLSAAERADLRAALGT